mmetsp:Transcript_6917/g.16307  ORF Transcript_6917/g.16307 Transcript_6917/m.16307 type:complete len:202 (-) Transcript_6917:43-648(-)
MSSGPSGWRVRPSTTGSSSSWPTRTSTCCRQRCRLFAAGSTASRWWTMQPPSISTPTTFSPSASSTWMATWGAEARVATAPTSSLRSPQRPLQSGGQALRRPWGTFWMASGRQRRRALRSVWLCTRRTGRPRPSSSTWLSSTTRCRLTGRVTERWTTSRRLSKGWNLERVCFSFCLVQPRVVQLMYSCDMYQRMIRDRRRF